MAIGVRSYGTYSLVGTTVSANQSFTFDGHTLNNLLVRAIGNVVTVKINDEVYTHVIEAGAAMSFEDIAMRKITILENNANFILEGTVM